MDLGVVGSDSDNDNEIFIDLKQIQEIARNNNCNHMRVDLSYNVQGSIDLNKFEYHVRQRSENIHYVRIVDKELNFKTLEIFLNYFEKLEVIEFYNDQWYNLDMMTGTFPTVKEIILYPACINNSNFDEDFKSWFPNLTITRLGSKYKNLYSDEFANYSIINKCLDLGYITHITKYSLDNDTDYTFVKTRMANIKIERLVLVDISANYKIAMEILLSHPEISELEMCEGIKNDDFESICKNLKDLKVLDIKKGDYDSGDEDNYLHITNLKKLEHLKVRIGQIKDAYMEALNKQLPKLGIMYFKYNEKNEIVQSKLVENPPYNFHEDDSISILDSEVMIELFDGLEYSQVKKLKERKNEIQVYAKYFLTGKDVINCLNVDMNCETVNLRMLVLIKEIIYERNGRITAIVFNSSTFFHNKINFKLIETLLYLICQEIEVIHFSNVYEQIWYNFNDVDEKFPTIKRILLNTVPKFDNADDVFNNWKSWFPNVTYVKLDKFISDYEDDQFKFISMFITHLNTCHLSNKRDINYELVEKCLSNVKFKILTIDAVITNYDTFMDHVMRIMKSQPQIVYMTYTGYIKDEIFEWICKNMNNLKGLNLVNLSPAAYAHVSSMKNLQSLTVNIKIADVEVIKEFLSTYEYDCYNSEVYTIYLNKPKKKL